MKENSVDILLVEDSEYDAELAIMALKDHRITNNIAHVRDGQEALDFLLARGKYEGRSPNNRPRVVFLDLKLPKLNGLEVLQTLRENPITKKLPVVILTSSREESDVVRGYDLGANSYLVKPVDFDSFSKAIKDVGFYWTVLNQPPV